MFERLRMFLVVLRAIAFNRQFYEDVKTIAFETRENRTKIEELRAEMHRLAALIQQFFQELQDVRRELLEARELNEQSRQEIMRRLELIEQGLPDLPTDETTDSGWVM